MSIRQSSLTHSNEIFRLMNHFQSVMRFLLILISLRCFLLSKIPLDRLMSFASLTVCLNGCLSVTVFSARMVVYAVIGLT